MATAVEAQKSVKEVNGADDESSEEMTPQMAVPMARPKKEEETQRLIEGVMSPKKSQSSLLERLGGLTKKDSATAGETITEIVNKHKSEREQKVSHNIQTLLDLQQTSSQSKFVPPTTLAAGHPPLHPPATHQPPPPLTAMRQAASSFQQNLLGAIQSGAAYGVPAGYSNVPSLPPNMNAAPGNLPPMPVMGSQQGRLAYPPMTQNDTLQPHLARVPPPTTTVPAKAGRAKRKRREVDVPDVDLSNKDTFSIISLSTKFCKWLNKVIKNGSTSFTKGDAQQVAAYAEKHADNYFALKEGWVHCIKALDDDTEILKAWYAFDCLLAMPEFANPAVRATWEVRLPELITEYMELSDLSDHREKYLKILNAWRARLDPDTMLTIRKRLSKSGVQMLDANTGNHMRFKYAPGTLIDFLSEKEGVWIKAEVKSVDQKSREVTLAPTAGANQSDIVTSIQYAARNSRKPVHENGDRPRAAKKPRHDLDGISPHFD